MENNKYKVIIYVKDVVKPIVLTFSVPNVSEVVSKVEKFRNGELEFFTTENNDIVYINPVDVKCIMITQKNDI